MSAAPSATARSASSSAVTKLSSTSSSSSSSKSCRVRVLVRLRPALQGNASQMQFRTKIDQSSQSRDSVDEGKVDLTVEEGSGVKKPGTSTSSASSTSGVHHFRGITALMDQSASNVDVYGAAVAPMIDRVLRGGTACCFAYGHTGSGKSHTIVGYGNERGLYYHAVEQLIAGIAGTTLLVQVRCAELYQGKVYDLLADRAECFLREDADGQVHIRSSTNMDADGRVSVHTLRAAYAKQISEVTALVQTALATRAVGNSSLHSESSRSHAMIELQLVTPEVVAARESVLEAEANVVPVGKARDGMYISIMSRCCKPDPNQKSGWVQDLTLVPQKEHDELEQLQQQVASLEEKLRIARENEAQAVDAAAATLLSMQTSSNASSTKSRVENLNTTRSHECGTLVLVDLAGSEYANSPTPGLPAKGTAAAASNRGASASSSSSSSSSVATKKASASGLKAPTANRSAQELSEGREINSSLLSLKEVVRALSRKATHVPFRNSKLTLLLRRYLKAHAAIVTMIATVAPDQAQSAATFNTLQYAALFADAKQG